MNILTESLNITLYIISPQTLYYIFEEILLYIIKFITLSISRQIRNLRYKKDWTKLFNIEDFRLQFIMFKKKITIYLIYTFFFTSKMTFIKI